MKSWGNFEDMIYYHYSFPHRYSTICKYFVQPSFSILSQEEKSFSNFPTHNSMDDVGVLWCTFGDLGGKFLQTSIPTWSLVLFLLSSHHISDWSIRLRMIRSIMIQALRLPWKMKTNVWDEVESRNLCKLFSPYFTSLQLSEIEWIIWQRIEINNEMALFWQPP